MATDAAREQLQEKAQQAQEMAQQSKRQARERAREEVDRRSSRAGEQVSASAQALRTTSRHLHDEGQSGPARAAERLADHAERLGGYLNESDADRILDDVEDFARRRPMAVVGAGVLVGFAASRFLKASSVDRYESRRAGGSFETGAPPARTGAPPPIADPLAPRTTATPGATL